MPSPKHEALVMLFRNRPELAGELLRAASLVVPTHTRATLASETLRSVQPVEIAADAVVVFHLDDRPVLAVVVEVQLSPDDGKLLTWPCYIALLRRDLSCPCVLLVVALDEAVARWSARRIALGHPGLVLRPVVAGSEAVPWIDDEARAAGDIELAVLSAVAHGRSEDAVAVALAAVRAIRSASLDDHRSAVYFDLVLGALGAAARAALEAEMKSTFEYQSDFARKYFGEGFAEGEAVGALRAERKAVVSVLSARGFVVDAATTARIEACKDAEVLALWISRAVSAPSIEAVFEEGGG